MTRTRCFPLSTSAGIALLSLGVSALPMPGFAAQASDSPWVYGVAVRDAEDAMSVAGDFVDYGKFGGSGSPGVSIMAVGATGAGVVVAIVDTGIDLDHPEFTGRVLAGTCIGDPSTKCSGASANGVDNEGHGTHVAGIVAAADNGVGKTGVAPGASLFPVKVLDASGSGSYAEVAGGITYAATHGADVINLSLGGPSSSGALLTALQGAAPTAVIVAAAGNNGNRRSPSYPAAYATATGVVGSMIIVGSVDANNRISSFSQTPGSGGCTLGRTNRICFKDVFLVAPGRNIYSTYPDNTYATMSGTSMATPYVAGVAALVLSASPFLTPQQVVSILLNSATDLGTPGTDTVYGRGLVNASAALAPLGGTSIATSGGMTSSYVGTGEVGTSSLSGPIGHGVRHSKIANDVVFFDAYGRDFRGDLTKSVAGGSMSLGGVVVNVGRPMRSIAAFGEGYAVSGFVADDAPSEVETAGFARASEPEMRDVVVTARFGEGTTMSVGHIATFGAQFDQLGLAASEAYDGLFLSAGALNSPYLGLTNDADFAASRFSFGEGLALSIGHADQDADGTAVYRDGVLSVQEMVGLAQSDASHQRSASNTAIAMSWQLAPWAMVGLNAGHTDEQNSLLGSNEAGALALIGDALTASYGLGLRVNLGSDWVATASWSQGATSASPSSGSLFQSVSEVESEAYGVAISKRAIFGGQDSLGFSVSRPLHITSGSALMTLSTDVTETREIIYSTERLTLASATPETDYELGYTARLDEGLTLQASTLYQQNLGGEAGRDGVAAFATLKANW